MGLAMGCMRLIMIIFNLANICVGGLMLGVSIWLLVEGNKSDHVQVLTCMSIDDSLWQVGVYMMLSVGIVLIITGFVGCFGSSTNNSCLLFTFASVMGVYILVQIVYVIFIGVFFDSLNGDVMESMRNCIKERYIDEDSDDSFSKYITDRQLMKYCCGASNFSDYVDSQYVRSTNNSVPWTCCVLKSGTDPKKATKDDVHDYIVCQEDTQQPDTSRNVLHRKGCFNETAVQGQADTVTTTLAIVIGVNSGLIALQIVGLVATVYQLMKKNQYR